MIYATLHLRLPDGQTLLYNVEKESITIGRAPENDLVLSDATIAPQQARITVQPGQLTIEDLGSIGGITLDGKRIEANKEYSLMQVKAIRLSSVDMVVGAPNSAPPLWQPLPATQTTQPTRPFTVALTPKRSTRDFTVTVTRNKGGTGLLGTKPPNIILAGRDANESMAFTFKPQTMRLESGESKNATLEVRGKPGHFTITATGEGYSIATKGQLLAVNRLPLVLAIVLSVSILLGVLLVMGSCPTVFSDVCGFVPNNPISLVFSTATFTPTNTRTATATFTATTSSVAATTRTVVPQTVAATATPANTSTIAPTPKFEGGFITYKLLQTNGTYSLMALPSVGNPIVLLTNKTDMRVLDYSRARNLFAIDVFEANKHFVWLVTGEGKVVREAINDGWDKLNEVDFAPDGSFFVLEGVVGADQVRYYFYNPSGELIRTSILQPPTATSTLTRTPFPTNTSTVTPTPSRTPPPSITPTPSRTVEATSTP